MLDLATRLKFIRTVILEMSRKELSNAIGIPPLTFGKWETRVGQPQKTLLEKYVKGLNTLGVTVSEEWLMTGVGISPFGPPPPQPSIKLENTVNNLLEICIAESFPPFLQVGDMVKCLEVEVEDVHHKDILIIYDGLHYILSEAYFTIDDDLFYAPIINSKSQDIKRFGKKNMKLFAIVGFDAVHKKKHLEKNKHILANVA